MDHPRVIDLLRIVTLVQGRRRLRPADLAEACGKSQRSVYRDLRILREAGIPIEFDESAGGYRLAKGFHMPPVHLTVEEGLAIFALCEQVAEGEQVPFLRPAMEAAHKVLSSLPDEIVSEVAGRARHIAIRTGPTTDGQGHGDVYGKVQRALRERRALECRYDAAVDLRPHGNDATRPMKIRRRGESNSTFFLEPYSLLFSVRAWYVIGRRDDRDEPRCMRLSRFTLMKQTDRTYEIPDDFSLERHLGNAWRMMRGDRDERIELRFDAEVAQTVSETRWHRAQDVEEHADGSCIFRCTVSGFDEIAWWILGYGPHCRVLRPAALRERVRSLVAKTAALYEDAPALTPRLARGADARTTVASTRPKRKHATG